MDEKLPRIRQVCSILFIASRILFFATLLLTGLLLIYAVVLMFFDSTSFTSIVTSTDLQINNGIPISIGTVISNQYIQIPISTAASAKWLNITNLLSDIILLFTPFLFIMYYARDTFFNIAYGNRPFTKESSFNLKIMGIIIVGCSLFFIPIKTLVLSIATGSFFIQLYANIAGLVLGFLLVGLSYLFEYIQDIQDANVVLVQVLQEDVEAEIQQEESKKEMPIKPEAGVAVQPNVVKPNIVEPKANPQPQPQQARAKLESRKLNEDILDFGGNSSDISRVFDEF